jgi:hypothetical protein
MAPDSGIENGKLFLFIPYLLYYKRKLPGMLFTQGQMVKISQMTYHGLVRFAVKSLLIENDEA